MIVSGSMPALAQNGEVNVYTNREPGPYSATLDAFTKATGIKVNAVFAEKGLAERISAEGENSPGDVLITVDIGRLQEAVDMDLVQPLKSAVLEANIPAAFRDPEGKWFGMSLRSRVVYVSKDRVKDEAITYESLADPKWKGKVCIRSGQHQYNIALIAAMIAKKGEAETEKWLIGLRDNLARKPSGGDRDVAKDIAAGTCDIGLANAYYMGLMTNGDAVDQKAWASAVRVINPTFEGGGTHVNVSGAALLKYAPNRDNAIKLLEYLSGEEAQKVFADVNFEYPVREGVPVNPFIASFGVLNRDPLPVAEIAKFRKAASQLVDKVQFDEGPQG